ncbi:hypothetical protein PLEOSDRAFT_1045508 [Pleurotus ostreatus PC15]|uniref:CCHC-type domain-containing protein n=1 Tax=Pleurotus ostreatus (strain PC15) TaxID=1137138 RepID=A0A067NGH0_PLEO1|nr:hypothetical protein PLEOSDRAFT_1045508 [Pleurotus ostreatus PC15]
MKFRRGLDSIIQSRVAESADCPDKDDFEGWYKAAQRVADNRAANQSFHFGVHSGNSGHSGSLVRPAANSGVARTPAGVLPAHRTQLPPLQPRFQPPPPPKALSPSVPMDVDHTRSRPAASQLCYRCGKPGHMSRGCPLRYDVRFMTTKERMSAIEDLLTAADVVESTGTSEGIDAVSYTSPHAPLGVPPYAPFGYSDPRSPSGSALVAHAWCAALGFTCYMFHLHVYLHTKPHYIHVLVSIYSSTSRHVFPTLNLSSFSVTCPSKSSLRAPPRSPPLTLLSPKSGHRRARRAQHQS